MRMLKSDYAKTHHEKQQFSKQGRMMSAGRKNLPERKQEDSWQHVTQSTERCSPSLEM